MPPAALPPAVTGPAVASDILTAGGVHALAMLAASEDRQRRVAAVLALYYMGWVGEQIRWVLPVLSSSVRLGGLLELCCYPGWVGEQILWTGCSADFNPCTVINAGLAGPPGRLCHIPPYPPTHPSPTVKRSSLSHPPSCSWTAASSLAQQAAQQQLPANPLFALWRFWETLPPRAQPQPQPPPPPEDWELVPGPDGAAAAASPSPPPAPPPASVPAPQVRGGGAASCP